VTVLRASEIRVSKPAGRRAYIQIDGEFLGHLPAELKIVPNALTVLVPAEYGSVKKS